MELREQQKPKEQKPKEQQKPKAAPKRLKAIVEISWGIGNLVNAIPLLNAMRIHDVEVDILWAPDAHGDAISLLNNVLLRNRVYGPEDIAEIEKKVIDGEYTFGISCYLSRHLVNSQKIAEKIPVYFSTAGLNEQEDVSNLRLFLKAMSDLIGKTIEINVPRQLLMNIGVYDDYEKYGDYIIICLGCKKGWENRLYHNWEEVINTLQDSGYKVAILADQQDIDRNQWMIDSKYEVIQTGLDEAFYVAMKCKLMISTDTGLAHLRSIDGRLQIMIFGPTYVKKNIPLSDRCVVVTSSDMECMPCQGTTMFAKCKEHKCMDIDAALIVDIAKKLLAGEKIVAEPDAQSGMSKPNMLKTGKTPDNDEINVNKNFIEFGGK